MFLQLALCVTVFFLSILLLRRTTTNSLKPEPKCLNQIPGPIALPIIGHLYYFKTLFLHHIFHKLAAKYGPLFHLRVGLIPAIILTTPESAKEFLKIHDLDFQTHSTSLAIQRLTSGAALTFSPYGQYWKFMRKLCVSKFLNNRVVNQFKPVRVEEMKCFIKVLLSKAKRGEQINFTKEVRKLTTNILSRMMMGVRCSGTEEGAKQALLVHEVAQIFGIPNLADVFPIFRFYDFQGIKKKCDDLQNRWDAMMEEILVKREEARRENREIRGVIDEENCLKDFLDILYDMVDDENSEVKLNRDHIKGIILDLFTAGTATTSTTIEWTLAELLNNQKIMRKAQQEIDNVVGRKRLVTELDTPNLPYIQAIIKETLRLHPAIPVFPRRAIHDCVVMGIKVPAGTFLFINLFSMGRDPRHWENPLEFKPERFLNDDATSLRDVKGTSFELLPFGTGKRGCPGMHLALHELHSTVAAIIQCFDWKVMSNNGVVEMEERSGATVPRARDLLCVPMARIDNLEIILE